MEAGEQGGSDEVSDDFPQRPVRLIVALLYSYFNFTFMFATLL
jgi:hypothetical protein